MPQLSDRAVPLPGPDPAEVCGAHQLSTQNILASCRARSPPSLPCPRLCHVTEFGQWGASRREVCRPSSGPSDAPACGTQRGTTTQPSKGMGRSTHTRGPQTVTSTSKNQADVQLTQHRSQRRRGVCAGSGFWKHDLVGEFHGMFTLFFVFFQRFGRVMNCFYIKNKSLSPEMKAEGPSSPARSWPLLRPSWLPSQLQAPKNVGGAPLWSHVQVASRLG